MGKRWRSFVALPPGDRLRLSACFAGLALVHAGLALRGYARVRRAIEAISRRNPGRMATVRDIAYAKRIAELAAIAGANGPVEATCLRQSLLVYGWLRRKGLQPVLQLGVADARGATFTAHAWVELEGERLRPGDAGHRAFVNRREPERSRP